MTIPRDPPNPPLGRWGKTWRVAFVVIVGFLAWVTVRSTLPDDISPALRLWAMLGDLLAGIAAGVLTIWRRRWPLRIALIVTLHQVGLGTVLDELRAIGWWFARRRGLATWPLVSQVMTVAVTAALVYGSIRFRIAADFALLVLAGVGAAGLLPSADRRPPPRSPTRCRRPRGRW